jgi:hypothetical protein
MPGCRQLAWSMIMWIVVFGKDKKSKIGTILKLA